MFNRRRKPPPVVEVMELSPEEAEFSFMVIDNMVVFGRAQVTKRQPLPSGKIEVQFIRKPSLHFKRIKS